MRSVGFARRVKISTVELRMSEIADVVGGRRVGPDATVDGASIDSRSIGAHQLFVPIVAERDGHRFIDSAVEAGATGYLTAAGAVAGAGATAVEVADTMAALTRLGHHVRDRLERSSRSAVRVVGVTGSVGKTSVKDLLFAVLKADRGAWASERSFNNELGVPLTLLNAPGDTDTLVIEMGARGAGHVKELCDLARPSVGIVTRVAAVHTEQFGTLEDVARAKGELIAALPPQGVAVLNAMDPRVMAMASRSNAKVMAFGAGGDVRAESVRLDDELRPAFRLVTPAGQVDLQLESARGVHMVENALAAAAAATACEVPLDTVAGALEGARLSPWRMELLSSRSGGVILNDAYNANPTSMAAALHSLAALPAIRRVAVLGEMAELGPRGEAEHRAIGELARELGIEVVTLNAPAYGGELATDLDQAAALVGEVGDGVAVLIKGSRVAGLERLADRLAN